MKASDLGTRDLSYDEKARWGKCPICHAMDGEPCYSEVGIPLGRTLSGGPPEDGAHLGRLNAAPRSIRIEPVP